ncbi:MAG: hypothetical protein D6756_14370 [Cyanobacteria bacterium J083]|nr:MAG: hypothetical protein D6756_14370 [Cyanobacteria bacterium J083]
MSQFKYSTKKTTAIIALIVSTITVIPLFPLNPALGQLFPRNRERVSRRQRTVIPAGTRLPLRHEKAEKILVTKDETLDVTLQVAANIKNRYGDVLIPYGSEVIGRIEPAGNGSQFVAEKLRIRTRDGDTVEEYINGTSDIVTRTEKIKKDADTDDIVEGALIGAAAGVILAEITGDIDLIEVIGGAGVGALAGWLLGKDEAELVSIDPNRDLDLTLESDLALRY